MGEVSVLRATSAKHALKASIIPRHNIEVRGLEALTANAALRAAWLDETRREVPVVRRPELPPSQPAWAAGFGAARDVMLSSTLKFGTTKHLAPHQYQLDGDDRLSVPPLR